MSWYDIFKLWHYSSEKDPISRRAKDIEGAGVTDASSMPDLRNDGSYYSGGRGNLIRLRDSTDFIDLSSITNRQSRYKEYERLRTVAEIETALTVFADESCVTGETQIATPFGFYSIKDLAEQKPPDENFLVYCYDFAIKDYTLGWAYHPRLVKKAETISVCLDRGDTFTCTPDHQILLRSGDWLAAGDLKKNDELMPFWRLPAKKELRHKQFARVFTFNDGWKSERIILDEFRSGIKDVKQYRFAKIQKYIRAGLNQLQAAKILRRSDRVIRAMLKLRGYTWTEVKDLNRRFRDNRRVLHIIPNGQHNVYDLSVHDYENFATNTTIFHNCQIGKNNHLFEINCKNKDVIDELSFMFFHPKMLNMDRKLWNVAKNLYLRGDHFAELIIDPEEPKAGILRAQNLPADSMYRIETIKGKLLEFQQSKEGPDYNSLARVEVTKATQADLAAATAIRFTPEQVVHFKIGDDRQTFYPYGVSVVEAARPSAHSLRLLEDLCLCYRLCLKHDTRVKTTTGYKYIKDLTTEDKVYSYNNEKLVPADILWTGCNGKKPVYKITTKTSFVEATEDHPILVRDKKTKNIDYLPVKQLIPLQHEAIRETIATVEIPKKIERYFGKLYGKISLEQKEKLKNTKFKRGEKLNKINKVLDKLEIVKNHNNVHHCYDFLLNKIKIDKTLAEELLNSFNLGEPDILCEHEIFANRINLPEFVDEDFASLLGFIVGDGYISTKEGKKKSGEIGICSDKDSKINDKYSNLLGKYFGYVYFTKNKDAEADYAGAFRTNSYHGCQILKRLGILGKATTKRIPQWLFTERKSVRKAFIIGLLDADGDKQHYNNKNFASRIKLSNKKLIEDTKDLWESIGLWCGDLRYYPPGWRHIGKNKNPSYCNASYSVSVVDKPLPKFEPIKSIELVGEHEVYDIAVKDHHNFIANGMVVHNSRSPERRVWYIDVGQLPPFKAEAMVDRIRDQLRKIKTTNTKGLAGGGQANPVEEHWVAPSMDDDFWIPIRPNSNTRVETLPEGTQLGYTDDALYFRNKLFIALCFPKNYIAADDSSITKVSLSSLHVTFARLIERMQSALADGLMEIAQRHLSLRGFPIHLYDDLHIKLTPPSYYREISENEVEEIRYNRAMAIKGSQIMADIDILTRILKVPEAEALEIVARADAQKIKDLKLNIFANNPQLMGLTQAPPPNEMGTAPGGPQPPQLGAGEPQPPPEAPAMMKKMGKEEGVPAEKTYGEPAKPETSPLPEPKEIDLKKYDLEIDDLSKEIDEEEIDNIELDE